jgi:hypothetical protein
MKTPCSGTLYKVAGKTFCVGEKLSKKVKGKTTTVYRKKPHKNRRTRKG